MKQLDNTINFKSNGLDKELEAILYQIVENARNIATGEGFDYIMDIQGFEDRKPAQLLGLRAPGPCFICGNTMGNFLTNWYCDANGNIVHKNCYNGGVI